MSYFKEFISSIWIITCGLVVRTCICTSCADKTIESIICIGMRHLSASLATLWN